MEPENVRHCFVRSVIQARPTLLCKSVYLFLFISVNVDMRGKIGSTLQGLLASTCQVGQT